MSHTPIATFKELCLDTAHAEGAAGRFWAAATGGRFTDEWTPGSGDVVPPDGGPEGMGIAICPVPEGKTVKNRVHLDVIVRDVQDLVDLGATVVDRRSHWTVLQDPEGNELCAFVRDEVPAYAVQSLVVDAVDADVIAGWWREVFGVPVSSTPGKPWRWLEGVPGLPMENLVFLGVPEPKTVKNRLHWDVYGDVQQFLDRGATLLWEMPRWTVLADPEGNEFCVFAPR